MEKIGLKRGKLELLTGLLGFNALKSHQRRSDQNQEAEDRWVRKNVYGDEGQHTTNEDDMGTTVLGDVTNPTPIVVQGSQGSDSTLKTLATLALGGMLGGGGIAAGAVATYLLNKAPEASTTIEQRAGERVQIGLGKIDDYFKKAPKQ